MKRRTRGSQAMLVMTGLILMGLPSAVLWSSPDPMAPDLMAPDPMARGSDAIHRPQEAGAGLAPNNHELVDAMCRAGVCLQAEHWICADSLEPDPSEVQWHYCNGRLGSDPFEWLCGLPGAN